MKIEGIIYIYFAICVAMIVFNIISVLISRRRDKKLFHISQGFENRILCELRWVEENGYVRDGHKKYLTKQLKRIGNMRAFDMALERIYSDNAELGQKYLLEIGGVFASVVNTYCKRDVIEAAYFPYIIKKYKILNGYVFNEMLDMMYMLLHEPSIYCRENAMQAIYTIGDASCVIKALQIIDRQQFFYHNKLITDGLLHFGGSSDEFGAAVWEAFEDFSVQMQVALVTYFRFSSGIYVQQIFQLMIDETRYDELRFACIRYFGKYRYEPAHTYLLEYADIRIGRRWEYAAIASTALSSYPSEETIKTLKSNLYHRNWYIRYNASQSLEKMGLTYLDLIDIIEGADRYASEILRYRFDLRDIREAERGEKVLRV